MKERKRYTLIDYEVTRDGEIINKHNNHKRILQPNTKGYLRVMINGKNLFVHRLVAEKFVPNPDNKPQVNHINGNKLDNRAENLEWVTNQENRNHAIEHGLHTSGDDCTWSKLNSDKVKFIREHQNDISTNEFCQLFNVAASTIRSVITHKSWKNVE